MSMPGLQLINAIETFIDGWNNRCHPFTWTDGEGELVTQTYFDIDDLQILDRCIDSRR
jgi:hypothetical protein